MTYGIDVYKADKRPAKTTYHLLFKFEPRDLWVGCYWDKEYYFSLISTGRTLKICICLIPCLPIIFFIKTIKRQEN